MFQLNISVCVCHILWSTTSRVKVALWLRFFSFGFRAKQMYCPSSSKVMFHSRMEMLLLLEEPTKSTRSWYTWTLGSTPSEGITASQSYTHTHTHTHIRIRRNKKRFKVRCTVCLCFPCLPVYVCVCLCVHTVL